MKTWIAFLICALSLPAFAAEMATETATTGMTVTKAVPQTSSSMVSDLSLSYSSLLKGTSYVGVGLMKEWDNGYALGARGYMPLTFDKDTTVYMAQAYLRILFLNELNLPGQPSNQMYLEPAYTQGFYNHSGSDMALFGMVGVTYGFNHQFNKNLMVGASLGVDYSTAQANQESLASSTKTFYNKISILGGYYF